jgi:hypothetical protein
VFGSLKKRSKRRNQLAQTSPIPCWLQNSSGSRPRRIYTISQSAAPPPDPSPSHKDHYLRDPAGSPSLNHPPNGNPHAIEVPGRSAKIESPPPEIPPDILQLSATFPFPWSVDLRIRKRIREALPPRNEARAICEEAQRNALWQ